MKHLLNWIALSVVCWVRSCSACSSDNSTAVGTCLHVYLERDFPSIEAIVYPNKQRGATITTLLLDGPELKEQCKRLEEVMNCITDLQYSSCYYYQDFFTFRHLVRSLRKSLDWVCEDLRDRFRKILGSFHCIEEVRLKIISQGHACYRASLPPNLWQRIIRLQTGTEVCRDLQYQVECLTDKSSNLIRRHCPEAETIYRNLTGLFIQEWCSNSASTVASSQSLSILFCILYTLYSLISG